MELKILKNFTRLLAFFSEVLFLLMLFEPSWLLLFPVGIIIACTFIVWWIGLVEDALRPMQQNIKGKFSSDDSRSSNEAEDQVSSIRRD